MAQRSNVPTRLVIRPQQPMWVVPDSGLSEPVSLPWIDGDEWAFEVKSISTNEELSTYAQLQTTQQRDDFIAQFWARRDPTPGTPENEFRDEYDRRTRLARQQYTIPDFPGVFGHDTDRGRVHVMFGAPTTSIKERLALACTGRSARSHTSSIPPASAARQCSRQAPTPSRRP
jgi:GWxTD domain-containing protein